MRQGITTRFIGPSGTRGGRIKAIARKRSSLGAEMGLTIGYPYEGIEKSHTLAAKALAAKLEWSGLWVGGGKPEEDGYMFVSAGEMEGGPSFGLEDTDWFYIPKVKRND